MRIAMLSERASSVEVRGGAAELSAAMAGQGHEVILYTRRTDPASPDEAVVPQGYTVVNVPAGPAVPLSGADQLDHLGAFAEYLDRRWSAGPPDLAHAHFWVPGIAAQLAARVHRVPTVQTFHGLGWGEKPSARAKLERTLAHHATWVAATSTEEVLELSRLGRPRTRTSVVPRGVDLQKFSSEGPIAARTERPRIVAVGKMLPRNGFDTVIEVLPTVPDAEFVIVGGPEARRVAADPEVRRLRRLAAELGVADRVVFTGAVLRDDMPAMLRSADVVTCTPRYAEFGIVALEAMACGIPVVASALGGMLDTVVHDVTGRLVVPNRPRECAEALTGILRDSFLRRSLGLAGRDRVCARYSWDRVATDALRGYRRLVPAGVA